MKPFRRKGLFWAAGVLAAILIVAAAIYAYLSSNSGNRQILRIVVQAINREIAGRIEIESLRTNGSRVVLTGIVLRDPEGQVAARVAWAELLISLLPLATKHLDIVEASLNEAKLDLAVDARGFNLTRAFAPRATPSAPRQSAGSRFTVQVQAFGLMSSSVRFRAKGGEAFWENISARGNGRFASVDDAAASIALTAEIRQPVQGTTAVKADLLSSARGLDAQAQIQAPGIEAEAVLTSADAQSLTIRRLRVDPEAVRVFFAAYPVRAPVTIEGSISQRDGGFETALDVSSTNTQLKLAGRLRAGPSRHTDATLTIGQWDLEQTLGLPKSDLSGTIRISGTGDSLDSFRGSVIGDLTRLRTANVVWGLVRAQFEVENRALRLAKLTAESRDVSVAATGVTGARGFEVEGAIKVSRLAPAFRAIAEVSAVDLNIDGSGTLNFRSRGQWPRLSVGLNGQFARFRYADISAEGLVIDAQIPEIHRIWESTGNVFIRRLSLAAKSFQNVRAQLVTHPRAFELQLSAAGISNLRAYAAGGIEPRRSTIRLDSLRLEYPEAQWNLVSPVAILAASGKLAIEGLDLRSDGQRIFGTVEMTRERVRASLALQTLDLSRLPKAFFGEELGLAGTATASVEVSGAPSSPIVKLEGVVDGGKLGQLQTIRANIQGTYERGRIAGSLRATAEATRLNAQFDVPVPLKSSTEAIDFRLSADRFQLDELVRGFGWNVPLSGAASIDLNISGTAVRPAMRLTVNGEQVSYRNLPPTSGTIELKTGKNATLACAASLSSGAATAKINGSADYSLNQLWTQSRRSDWLNTPVSADFEVRNLDLALLQQSGSLVLRGHASGKLSDPTLAIDAEVDGIRVGSAPALRVEANLNRSPGALTAKLQLATSAGASLGQIAVFSSASLSRLIEDFTHWPFEAKGSLSGWRLSWFRPPAEVRPSKFAAVDGRGSSEFVFRGSLEHPTADLSFRLDDLGLAADRFGRAEIAMKYADQRLEANASVFSKNGAIHATARSSVDLSHSSRRKGIAWEQIPLTADVEARAFELSTLRGLIPHLPEIGGSLVATGHLEGSWSTPGYRGDLEWIDGVLSIEGYGHYQKVHLSLSATDTQIALKQLSAEASHGTLEASGDAVRFGDHFTLSGRTAAAHFPLVIDNQLLASVSMESRWTGSASPKLVDLQNLELSEAHIDLPEIGRKNLQTLDRPNDISLVTRAKSKASAVLPARPAEAPPPPFVFAATVSAPRNLWVRGSDIDAEVGLSDGFRVEISDELLITGVIRFLRGKINVLGRRLELEKNSTVELFGPAKTPHVDVTGTYKNEREQVVVHLNARGTWTKDLAIQATSEPPLSEAEIYALVATGRSSLKHGSGSSLAGEQAVSAIGAVLATEAKKTFAKKLPLDIISLETGTQTGRVGVEAGKYVSDKIYLGGSVRFGADPTRYENSYSARLEYQLSRHWSLEAEFGDIRQAGDLIWSKDF